VLALALVLAAPPAGAQHAPALAREGERLRPQPECHRKMLELLESARVQALENNVYLAEADVPKLREELARLPADTPPIVRWRLVGKLGFHQLRLGRTDEAVASYEEARAMLPALADVDPREVEESLYQLGISYLRWGENQNCVARHSSESCLFPIRESSVHVDQEGSRKAIEVFEQMLARNPAHPGARWLTNIAYMTIGRYPEDVPKPFLIAPETFASDEPFPRFHDVARGMGFTDRNLAGGTILEDFDEDGHLDLVLTDSHTAGQMRYWKGHGDGTFEERTEEAGLAGLVGGLNCLQADYDNDGFTDILVMRGAWLRENGLHPDSLLHNNKDGTFTDMSIAVGLAEVSYPNQAAAWGDYDNDGDLDLYVGNENEPNVSAPCQLFRNDDGHFVDVAAAAGVRNEQYAKAVVWGDYDNDRFPDLYVSNHNGPNRLYHNNKDGTFTDVAQQAGVIQPIASFPAWFWDFDNDGALDIYVSFFRPELAPLVASWLGQPSPYEHARLYKGDGRGGFRDVAVEQGLGRATMPMGANFGDLDNDGYPDFYLGTGFPLYQGLMPNVMYRNRRGRGFADVTTAGGFGHLQKGHGIAFGDLDEDGDQDVFAHMGGAFTGDGFLNSVFQNPGFGNHWVSVKLVGTKSNSSAIGAHIRCEIVDGSERRSVHRTVNSGGSFGANPLEQHIGLGKAEKIDVLEIYWPTSDTTQTFRDVPVDRALRIVEVEVEVAVR